MMTHPNGESEDDSACLCRKRYDDEHEIGFITRGETRVCHVGNHGVSCVSYVSVLERDNM